MGNASKARCVQWTHAYERSVRGPTVRGFSLRGPEYGRCESARNVELLEQKGESVSRLNNDPCSSCGGQISLCDGCAIVTPSREWIGDAKIFATDAIGALSKRDPHEFLAFVGSSENALI